MGWVAASRRCCRFCMLAPPAAARVEEQNSIKTLQPRIAPNQAHLHIHLQTHAWPVRLLEGKEEERSKQLGSLRLESRGGNDVKHPWWRASAQHREVLSLCWSMPSVGPVGGGNAALDLDLDLPRTLEGWRRDEDGETDGNRQRWDARNQTVYRREKKKLGTIRRLG